MTSVNGSESARALALSKQDRDWIRLKWNRIRASQIKADAASTEWEQLNKAVNQWLDRKGEMDPVQRTRIKGENLGLKEALSTHAWHRDEAMRHIADVQLLLSIRQAGVEF